MAVGGQVALVLGGASGIGLATAQELLRAGANVALGDVATAAGEAAAQQLQAEFGSARAAFVPVDVRDDEQVEAAFSTTKQHFKKLDIFVNSAGIAENRSWKLTADVDIMGAIRGTMLAWKHLGKHEGGTGGVVVNVASILGLSVLACAPIYCAAKHAMVGLGRSCGMPYHQQRTGVRVITMCPGFTMTPIWEPEKKPILISRTR
ncbi:hypothetical protein R5R35_005771 [Gryllus longicercus]|uniref:Alcohol dehydrogenase n=1 Tax=Gryllus longicercus TaxID=2509291 RepID=A0AAN9VY68_9ORTH